MAAATPTFFTNWLGNNDVLGYATAGGAASSLTPTADFTTKNGKIVDALTASGAKGLVVTIPDVTNIPFFTTVGPGFKATLTGLNVRRVWLSKPARHFGGPTTANRKQIATADIKDGNGGRQLFTLLSASFLGLVGRPAGAPWRFVYGQSGLPKAGFKTGFWTPTASIRRRLSALVRSEPHS